MYKREFFEENFWGLLKVLQAHKKVCNENEPNDVCIKKYFHVKVHDNDSILYIPSNFEKYF